MGEVYEPPETTGAAGADAAEEEGARDGCCKPLPELAELDEDADWLDELLRP